MHTLRGRLITAFFGVIAVLVLAAAVFFAINLRVVGQYRSILDVMTAEYRLVDTMSTLIEAFNRRMQSAGTDSSKAQQDIDSSRKNITDLTGFLDTSIADTQSRSD